MNSTFLILLVVVTVPFVAAIGHDLWLYYENPDNGFLMSEIGFIWKRYSPESFKITRDILNAEEWNILNRYILDQKTIVLTGVFAVFLYVMLIGNKLLSGISSTRGKYISKKYKNKKIDAILGEMQKEKYDYKRK